MYKPPSKHGPQCAQPTATKKPGYLEHFDLRVGYPLSFDFRRAKNPGVERVSFGDAALFGGTV